MPGAIGHLRTALELDDENPEAHLLMGLIQYQRQNLPVAEEHTGRAVELLVAQERHGATLAEARNVHGIVLTDLGRYDDAATVLRESAMDEMNTQPHLAWGNLGLAYLEKGDPESALEPLQQAVRSQPLFCVGYARLGRAYFELDRMEEAEDALVAATDADDSCRNNPALQNALRLRGEARARLGHRAEAIEDLERCVGFGAETEDGRACQRLLDATHRDDDGGDTVEDPS